MISQFPSWAHALSYYYKIPLRQARALNDLGLLPNEGDAAALHQPTATAIDPNDDDAIAVLESVRSRFDTEARPFIDDLYYTASELISDGPEPHEMALVAFRDFSSGNMDRAYPVTKHAMPWHKHRVAVTRAELLAAGYAEFHALWGGSDPFEMMPLGGEIPLGPGGWVRHGHHKWLRDLRVERGQFLLRLVDVLEARK